MPTQPPPAPPSLPKKCLPLIIRLLLGLTIFALVLTVLIPGLYLVEKYRGRAAWQAYETEAKARGVKLDFADYIPPKIPDAENFASIPIFDAVFRASEAKEEIPNPFKLPPAKNGKLPNFADPVKQERIDLIAWQMYFVETKLLPSAGENAAADVLKALENFAEPLTQLREASTRPHCRFPVKWEQGFAASLPQWPLLMGAAKINALRLSAHLTLGDNVSACEDFRDGLRLITVTREEPSLIAGLVRIACGVTMENAVWSGLAGHQWTEANLRNIEADLFQLDWFNGYLLAMGSERGFANGLMDMLIEKRIQLAGLVQDLPIQAKASSDKWTYSLYPTGWFYRSKVRSNQFFDEMLARFEPGQRRWFGERAVPSSPEHIKDMPTKMRYMIFMIATPALEQVEKKFVQVATVTDHARLACSLERFRLARGAYPETLAALAPEFIPAVPAEIVNGEPYRYRRAEDGSFVLYSVGTDLRDDGGVTDPKLSASKQADWVWRYPAK